MKRAFLFGILGFVLFAMGLGVIMVNLKKAEPAEAAPAPVQTVMATVQPSPTPTVVETSADPTDEPTEEPTEEATVESTEPTSSETVDADAEEWFRLDYQDIYKKNFGKMPSEEVQEIALSFAQATCANFDDGYTLDEVAAGIVDSGGSQKAQAALALAVRPGVLNLCPWNKAALG
jgi:hypothetical protein